jgi:hypothetical protein
MRLDNLAPIAKETEMFSDTPSKYPDSPDLAMLMEVLALHKSQTDSEDELIKVDFYQKRFLISAFMSGLYSRHDLTIALKAYELLMRGQDTVENQKTESLRSWENEGGYVATLPNKITN